MSNSFHFQEPPANTPPEPDLHVPQWWIGLVAVCAFVPLALAGLEIVPIALAIAGFLSGFSALRNPQFNGKQRRAMSLVAPLLAWTIYFIIVFARRWV